MLWKLIVMGFMLGAFVGCGTVMDKTQKTVHAAGEIVPAIVEDTVENVDCVVEATVGDKEWDCLVHEDEVVK